MSKFRKSTGLDLSKVEQNDLFDFMAAIAERSKEGETVHLNAVEYHEGATVLMIRAIFYFQVFDKSNVEKKGVYNIHRAVSYDCSQSSFTWS